ELLRDLVRVLRADRRRLRDHRVRGPHRREGRRLRHSGAGPVTGEGNGRTPVHSPRTIVHLIRHGEVHNPGKILYGRLPGYRLSDRGRAMAEATAEAFAGHDVAYVACSPLQRTRETCEPVTRVTGLEPVIDPDVLEAGNT